MHDITVKERRVLPASILHILLVLPLFFGCGLLDGGNEDEDDDDDFESEEFSPCEALVLQSCENCDVGQAYQDTVCECVLNGEIANAQRYYSSKDAAEIACADTQNRMKISFVTNDELVECRRSLQILQDFGEEGCEELGFSSSGDDDYDYGYDYGSSSE
jgi:hypothetical protein